MIFTSNTSKVVAPILPSDVTTEKVVTVTEKTEVTHKLDGGLAEKTTTTVDSKVETHIPLLKRIGFGKGTLTGVYKDNQIWALGRIGWEEPTESFTAEVGVVYTVNKDSSVRAKVKNNKFLNSS